jgi:hypothetical protein
VAVAACRGDVHILGQDRCRLDEAVVKKCERIALVPRLMGIKRSNAVRRREAMRTARIGAAIGILVALMAAPSVSAGPAMQSTITIEVLFSGSESFTATGGVACESGTSSSDGFATFGGSQNRGRFTFHVVKTLTCDGGAGTFKLLVDVAQDPDGSGTKGGFAVGEGTGSMTGIHGGGQIVGTNYHDGTGITDVYTGPLTIAP